MIPPPVEVFKALWGAFRLLRFDPAGFSAFDVTVRGFWRSFFAAVLVAPLYVLMAATHPDPYPEVSTARYVAVEGVVYVLVWLAFPAVMLHLVEVLDRRRNYIRYVVAYNWCAVWQNVLYVLAALPTILGLVPPGVGGMFTFAAFAVILAYGWFVARKGLDVSGFAALGVVALDMLLGLGAAALSQWMLEGG